MTAVLVSVARPALAADSATINGAQTFQTITGFGASEGFGQAETIMGASSSVETAALNDLFSPTSGAGLTILRNEISADSGDTIEPNAPSSPTATPTYLPLSSIGNDQDQLTLAQAIKADYGVTNVFADAWSAPGFMKTNDSAINGGTVCGVTGATCSSGNWVQAYANYLVQYAKDYSAAGVPLTYIGPENEANINNPPPSYDGMVISPSQTAQILDVLGPTLASSGLSTQMECCATEGWDFAQQYAAAIEADSTANADTAVFTSHGYTEAPTTPLSGWTKPAWETEWSTFESWDPAWDDGSDASGLTWAQHIFSGLDSANLNAFLYWWGSSTPSGNGDNESLIQINGSNVATSGRLWAFAGWSDYVRPGAVRIGATTTDGNLTLDAFKNTNGTIAIVALNTGSSSDTVNFALSGTGVANGATVKSWLTNSSSSNALQASTTVASGAFTSTLPARSLVTFTMPSGGTNQNTVTVTNPGAQTGRVGTAASLQIQATDSAAGQTLTYGATGLPAGLTINSSTGLISGTPTTAVTAAPVTVTATDTTGASGSAAFTWTINPSSSGQTVTVTNPGSQTGTVGTAESLQIAATDTPSGQTLTYTAANLPAGLSINSSTGLISGTPTTAGTSSVTVTATDGTGASGSAAFTWTIGSGGGGTGSCKVVYTNNSQWPGGWTSQVVITNTGTSALSSWSLVFTFPGDQKVTQNYNGGFSQSGETVTLTNASYNGSIAPNGSVTDGFQGTWTSSNASPTSFTLNGSTCTT
ncbi:MAG TPA: putative Ig domain-containing protein [Trebonia sp.]|nr:putative Ig domain-containing protein [Trebonia sp.]